jgi:hypothetical protein
MSQWLYEKPPVCAALPAALHPLGGAEMTNSQKGAIWLVLFAVAFLVTAFVGGFPALEFLLAIVVVLAPKIGMLCFMAVLITMARKV